jgi:hypothetical protein
MEEGTPAKSDKSFWSMIGGSAAIASLCCLTPLVLVMFGLSSVAFAASLADTLYGTYKWAFRGVGLLLLIITIVIYFRKQGVCTLDQAKRRRNEIINKTLLALAIGVLAYIFFLYVVVHYAGVWYGIWADY